MLRILRRLNTKFNQSSYHIGIIEKSLINSSLNWYSRVNWVDSHLFDKDGWFADPFIFSVNDKDVIIFAEQMVYATGRGRLVRLSINRSNYLLERVDPILELETHLSFPIIWRENSKVYVYPENYQSGKLSIWEYNGSNLVNPMVLIEEPLLDSQILKIKDKYFIFGVEFINGDLTETRHVKVWTSNSLFGPYYYLQSFDYEKNEGRGAGEIITSKKSYLRPAQCCEKTYGREVIMYELLYNDSFFSEKELYRIKPNRLLKYGSVLHTYNVCGNICVIDGLKYRNRFMYHSMKLLRRIINLFHK